ncbi:hypothetical protein [Legionella parisiensis]|uniref:Uncharacterized protein n=1 Tax=Legionella parisiensis TaxID=45071 RepID=A0A1E5JVB7_9GAMM|nr:hypothetical protein [Legionella parisiensis]KTD43118.1 hypothetical protein Lpar_1095 [Legionella parisiensis]OEH47998.1 hypothetical protein lpari_01022 [Legionella parisiensis]STX77803.1 Uncharacterised protein [Legionella parisiensis]
MKAKIIQKQVKLYDRNKGYFRALKDESHIKELREFCNSKLEGIDTLPPALLLELATILIGKKDREGDSESSRIFRTLVSYFGGYEALDCLNNQKQLSAEHAGFLAKNAKHAKELAPLLASIGKKISPSTMTIVLHAAEMMSEPEQLVEMFRCFRQFAFEEDAFLYFEILGTLNRYGINTDDVVPLLIEVKQPLSKKQALETLYRINPKLFNRDNVMNILKLKNPYYFYKLLELLPDTQDSLDRLFAVDDILDKCSFAEEIIKNFNSAGWNLQLYLNYILSVERNGFDIECATGRLKEMTIKPELLPLILETLFVRSGESIALVNAVEILNLESLEEDVLNLAFATNYPDRVAEAVVALKKAALFNNQTTDVICSHPKYAFGLARAMIQLSQLDCSVNAAYDGLDQYPQSADKVAKVIEYLQEHSLIYNAENKPDAGKGRVKLSTDVIVAAVCKAELTDDSLLKLLETMKAANLFDIHNLHKLIPKLKYVKTLASAARCLANSNQLDQLNFDSIISDPINSIILAEDLGGTPCSPSLPKVIDEGAQDFVAIRKAAKILASGQRQGLFFPKLEPEKLQTFEKATHRKMAAIQNEAMMKIAQFTSEHHLERATEYHIANSAYFSVLNLK